MITVRLGAAGDAAAIARLQELSPEAAQWPLGDYSGSSILIAAIDGVPAGFCSWRQTASDEAELLNLAVDPAFRRRGVGRALLEALEKAVAGAIFLEVAENNSAARALYRGAGWEDVALRKGYYDHGNINGIVMKKGS